MSSSEKAAPTLADQTVGPTEVASVFGRTKQWVLDLVKNGHLERVGRGRYRLGDVGVAVVRHYEASREASSSVAAASRVTDARTREIEQRIAIRERQLIPTDDAIAEYDILVAVCRKEIDGLPAAFTRDVADRRRLEKLCDGAKTRIADALGKAGDAARKGRTDPSGSD